MLLDETNLILYIQDGNKLIPRFSIEELKSEIHKCELAASSASFWGEDNEAAYYEWLIGEMKQALSSLISSRSDLNISKDHDHESLESIKSRIDIINLVDTYVKLKKSGRHFVGLCPFHSEKNPSFTVYPKTQSWFCFSCNKGGDIFTFIMLTENIDFKGAINFLRGWQS